MARKKTKSSLKAREKGKKKGKAPKAKKTSRTAKKTVKEKKTAKTRGTTKKMGKILVTSALPYANGPIHIGHLVEYIQTDIYVRFLKSIGEKVIYICADDTHGTPIEINAAKQGMKPEQFIKKWHQEHMDDFKAFLVEFDNYYTTHSKENKEYSDFFFKTLKEKGYIYTKNVESYYCEKCKRFLPDRYVKGKCPRCGADDQYGDVCEKCNATYTTVDLTNPYCVVCSKEPVRKESMHYFFKLSEFGPKLKKWFASNKNLQEEVKNYISSWLKDLKDWDISRDGPYFGFKIPGEKDKYYYVWLDAPIGYISSTENYCKTHKGEKLEHYWKNGRIIHFIGKDIIYFHFLFWPAMLMGVGFTLPDNIVVHGFLTVNKEKMSKSRGTYFTAKEFLDVAEPEFLRFFYAYNLGKTMSDIDLNFKEFKAVINNNLVSNLSNFYYRVLSFCNNNFDSKVGVFKKDDERKRIMKEIEGKIEKIKEHYANYEIKEAVKEILAISDIGNKYFQENAPWKLYKQNRKKTAEVIAFCVNIVKNLTILSAPVMPNFSATMQEQLNLKDLKWKDLNFNYKNKKINEAEIVFSKIEEMLVEEGEKWPFDLRIGKVVKVSQHPDADRLYVMEVNIGPEKRQIVAGIKEYYRADELVGKKVVILCNLKPTTIRGVESNGMLLAGDDGQKVRLLEANKSNPGDLVYPETMNYDRTSEVTFEEFMTFEILTKGKKAVYEDKVIRTDKEELKIDIKNGARVR